MIPPNLEVINNYGLSRHLAEKRYPIAGLLLWVKRIGDKKKGKQMRDQVTLHPMLPPAVQHATIQKPNSLILRLTFLKTYIILTYGYTQKYCSARLKDIHLGGVKQIETNFGTKIKVYSVLGIQFYALPGCTHRFFNTALT